MALTQISTQGIKDGTITGSDLTTNIDLVDSQRIRIGTSNDLEIFHNGNFNFIVNNNNKNLAIQAKDGENAIVTIPDAEVQLYHNNSLKFETTSAGATITGALTTNTSGGNAVLGSHLDLGDNQKARFGASDDLQIYHDPASGGSSFIDVTGSLQIHTSQLYINNEANTERLLRCTQNDSVELYYDGSQKLETTSAGVSVTGTVTATSFSGETVVGDTSPQLGGTLQSNGNMIRFADATGVNSNRLKFGTGDDLHVYHNGNNSTIRHEGTGSLLLTTVTGSIQLLNGSENMLVATPNGAVNLYHDNSKKFETHSAGVLVSGNVYANDNNKFIAGTHNDLQIYHDGSNSYIQDAGTGVLIVKTNALAVKNAAGDENLLYAQENVGVELFYDNSKKFETQNLGVTVTGGVYPAATDTYQLGGSSLRWNELNIKSVIDVSDNGKIRMGDSDDLQIYHDGTNSFIKNSTGTLNIQGDTLRLTDSGLAHVYVKGISGGATELYHNNIKKFETASTGLLFPNTGTLSQNAIYFEAGASTNEYSTMFGVTNYPDASDFGDQNDGFWAKIKSRGGCVVIINSDGGRNDGRNTYDHFSVYHREGESTNGKRAFSVDHVGGVQFGQAGINIDREWGNQPSFSMTRDCNDGTNNTDDNAYFRFHGTAKTHSSWTGGSNGADFSANMLLDGGNYNASDRRAKTDIVDCPYGLAEVLKLRPRKYQLVNSQLEPQGDDNINLGFIAQELMEILPEPVNYLKNEDVPNEKGFCRAYILDMNEVVPVLTKAIQELAAKVAVLETEVAALKAA